MHELILLRHAEAQPAPPGGEDAERRLSGRGEQEARDAGKWLKARGVHPERTCATATLALAALERAPSMQTAAEIYNATPGELLALLDQHLDARTVLLIGHNPGIERLVALLVEGRSDEFRGMPPAGLAVLHLDGALEPGNARLDAFWSP
jgi:phosphohistidine phosphatase